jgi:membrane protein required for colicin V production
MNWIDYLILALLVLSCIAGFMRGLLREIISLFTWLLAVVLAWRCADLLAPHLGGALASASVRPWAARTLIFIAVLVVGAVVGTLVSHFVRLSIFSGTDRLLGLVFGVARAVVALGLLAILAHAVHLENESWYRSSMLVPYAEKSAAVLRSLAGDPTLPVSSLRSARSVAGTGEA